MQGWIKLHRELIDKAIWQCATPEQKIILITILLTVNHEEKEWEWQGKKFICKPGQMITSLASLADKCGKGISVQNVRTALDKFEKYGFLTNQSTKTGRLITVENWAIYQEKSFDTNKADNKELTKHSQRRDKEATPNKNDKNDKNERNNTYSSTFEAFWKEYPRKLGKNEAYKCYQARLKEGYSEEELLQAVKCYAQECVRENRESKYIKHAKTFLGSNKPFQDYLKEEQENGNDESTEKRGQAFDYYRQFIT